MEWNLHFHNISGLYLRTLVFQLVRDMLRRVFDVSASGSVPQRFLKRRLTVYRKESSLPSILSLDKAVVGYPEDSKRTLGPIHLSIAHPSTGGHVLLGKNGSGKSLIAYTLASLVNDGQASPYLKSGSYSTEDNWHRRAVAKVSFQSHEELLSRGGTVSKTISDGGNLSKAAKFLIVRFGLYHHLHRQVNTLSTGEIRKVLLIRALANRPRLLILDNAFDGLDIETRETLKDLVSRTIQGFRPDILVQAVSAKATAHTQVLLMTNRGEEIVDDIKHVTVLNDQGLVTVARDGKSGDMLLEEALGLDMPANSETPWNQAGLPSVSEISASWESRGASLSETEPIIHAQGLHIEKNGAVLMKRLDWSVGRGERWLIAGRNGAGKSLLGRLLAKTETDVATDHFSALSNTIRGDGRRLSVGWCSTELHLNMTLDKSQRTVADVFQQEGSTPDMMEKVISWLSVDSPISPLHAFSELSQGQQKLFLIGAALASRPDILVLDEITQGLDINARNRVLRLLQRVCEATDTTLVYITHHLEEILPGITHVMHLVRGEPVYCGPVQGYDSQAAKAFEQTADSSSALLE